MSQFNSKTKKTQNIYIYIYIYYVYTHVNQCITSVINHSLKILAKPNKTNTYRPCCSAMFNNIFDVVEI